MDVDRSVASATARSSGNFDRAEDANGYHVSSHGRSGRQGNVGKSFRSLFKVLEPLLNLERPVSIADGVAPRTISGV